MSRKRTRRGFQLSEFPVVLFIFFIMFFPLINLLCLGCGACSVWLISFQTAATAVEQQSFAESLNAAANQAKAITQTGISKWVKLQPVGGYQNSGVNLFVEKLSFRTGSGQYWLYGPNASAPPPAQAADYIYSVRSEANFTVGPFLSMASWPWIGDIPGLGQPAAITITTGKAVEQPDHIVDANNTMLASSGSGSNVSAQPGGWKAPNGTGEMWTQDGMPILSYTVWVPDFPGSSTGYLFKIDTQQNNWSGSNPNVNWSASSWITGRYVSNYQDSQTGFILTGNQFSFNDTNGGTQTIAVNPGQNVDVQGIQEYCEGATASLNQLITAVNDNPSMSPAAKAAALNSIAQYQSWLQNNMPSGWW